MDGDVSLTEQVGVLSRIGLPVDCSVDLEGYTPDEEVNLVLTDPLPVLESHVMRFQYFGNPSFALCRSAPLKFSQLVSHSPAIQPRRTEAWCIWGFYV